MYRFANAKFKAVWTGWQTFFHADLILPPYCTSLMEPGYGQRAKKLSEGASRRISSYITNKFLKTQAREITNARYRCLKYQVRRLSHSATIFNLSLLHKISLIFYYQCSWNEISYYSNSCSFKILIIRCWSFCLNVFVDN